MNRMTRIDLVYQTTSPLCINSPEKRPFNPATGKWTSDGPEITTVQRLRLASDREADLERSHYTDTIPPIVPANTLRGLLRRAAADIISERLAAIGEKIELETYHVLTCGAPHGHPESGALDINNVQMAANNPYFGLFGGASKMFRSGLTVGTGFACTPATVAAGVVPPGVPIVQGTLTQVLFMRRVDDVLTFRTPLTGRVVKNYLEAVEEYREALGVNSQSPELADESAELSAPDDKKGPRGVRGWNGHEVVLPNVPFAQTLRLNGQCGEAHAGLLLLALRDLINQQKLGGLTRYGYGQYRMHGALSRVWFEDGTSTELFLTANDSRPPYALNTGSVAIQRALAAWEEIATEGFNTFIKEIETLSTPAVTVVEIKSGKATSKKKAGKRAQAATAG